jgi:hypothetical protein
MPIHPRDLNTTIRTTRASYDAAMAEFERETIRRVAEDMSGHDPNNVNAVLVARFARRLPGSELDHRNLHKVAAAIANHTYHDWAFPS